MHDVIMSRKAIHAMNHLFPDATPDEIVDGDNVCIICREEMAAGAKKLPCSHIFHAACLRSWFQRQQTCPTCRSDILNMVPPRAAPPPAQQTPAAARQQPPPAPAQVPNGVPPAAAPQNFNFPIPPQFSMPTSPQGSAAAAPPGMPPMVFPPFPGTMPGMGLGMPGAPFMLPFPPAPAFGGLSDEEVVRMEGTERGNVEARVQCLRNIQTLLDAAAIQLQQYTSILGALA